MPFALYFKSANRESWIYKQPGTMPLKVSNFRVAFAIRRNYVFTLFCNC